MSEQEYKSQLLELEVRPDISIQRDQVMVWFKSAINWTEVMTIGNISSFIGKAKSRKTFLLTLLVSAILANRNRFIKSNLTGNIAWFDTEQGKYHVWKVTRRIEKMLGAWPDKLRVFSLRSLCTSDRIREIENYVYVNDVQFLIIDGIRDLVTDINDAVQATEIVGKLMKWSYERDMHISIVIHQNKGDDNARGHIGTEIVNKSETVISVIKDKDDKEYSIVESVFTRGIETEPFRFKIEDNLPVIDEITPGNYYEPDKEEDVF